jgi:hypothetical protein
MKQEVEKLRKLASVQMRQEVEKLRKLASVQSQKIENALDADYIQDSSSKVLTSLECSSKRNRLHAPSQGEVAQSRCVQLI